MTKKKENNGKDDPFFMTGNADGSSMGNLEEYENAQGSMPGQVVYGLDENGVQVPIGIIFDGSFSKDDMSNEVTEEGNSQEIIPDQYQWVECGEECVTNDISLENLNTPEEIKVEHSLAVHWGQKLENESMSVNTDYKNDVIKVYKSRGHPKKTLINVKKTIRERKQYNKIVAKTKSNKKMKPFFRNMMKKRKKSRRNKNRDLAFHAPMANSEYKLPS